MYVLRVRADFTLHVLTYIGILSYDPIPQNPLKYSPLTSRAVASAMTGNIVSWVNRVIPMRSFGIAPT